MVGRQTDNNLKHYSLDQFLQQPQTSYNFTGMRTCDIYMEDVSLWHIIEVYNTFKLCLSSEKKVILTFFFFLSMLQTYPVLRYFQTTSFCILAIPTTWDLKDCPYLQGISICLTTCLGLACRLILSHHVQR